MLTQAAVSMKRRALTALGVLFALSLPIIGIFGTAAALVVAGLLAWRGHRRDALIVAGTALLLLLALLLFLTPVNTGEVPIRQG